MDVLVLVGVSLATGMVAIGGGVLLLTNKRLAKILQRYGSGIAALVLMAAVMFDLLPEALEEGLELWQALLLMLGGFLVFMVMGKVLSGWHKHGDERGVDVHGKRQSTLMLVVDGLHTVADGLVLGVAFAAGMTTGVWAAVGIVAHEVPREIGDFAVLVRAKWPRGRIIRAQALVALMLVPASLAAYWLGDVLMSGMPIVLAVVSGFFVYIAYGEICATMREWKSKKQ